MGARTLETFTATEYEAVEAELLPDPPARDEHPAREAAPRPRGKAPVGPVEPTDTLDHGYVLSVYYDGERKRAGLKLYEPTTRKIHVWLDNTQHLPYCLSDQSIDELTHNSAVTGHPGFHDLQAVQKYDALADREIEMTKIVATDPLSIGGRGNSLREVIPKAWEARIRYHNCYTFDRQLLVGMPYKIVQGNLVAEDATLPREAQEAVQEVFADEAPEAQEFIDRWSVLFQCPIPSLRRVAVDIEVASAVETRVPDPREAMDPIIAVAMVDSDGGRRVLLLRRAGIATGSRSLLPDATVEYYEEEEAIIGEIFTVLREYPVVLTFNGDDFDLRYIYHRALNLGLRQEAIPIILGERFAHLTYGIHVDLYKFFFNRSIQIYAFSQTYTELTLDSVAQAVLGVGKVDIAAPIAKLPYSDLAAYCLTDAEITFRLTAFDDELVMKLIQIMMRITKMPMEDLTRQGVSSWIRNLMYFEHRRLNYLIPRAEDILEAKGKATSEAIIKGKKFKGAIVVEPKPGIHFNVNVLDFASLYPSIIKVHNLSYETILCPHPHCRTNTIPGLSHWVCTERKGLSSLIIGSLRDTRIRLYKKMAKDRSLPPNLQNLYNVIQLTLKVLLNASYGVMGAESFNLYCPPLAEAVTALGRYVITRTVDEAKAIGIDVIYGDTDSVFLKAPTPSQVTALLRWSEETLGMELEIDKVYRYAVFSHLKKNYLGVYPDGIVDIKGLMGKKRHIPAFLKQSFMDMVAALGDVQSPTGFEQAKQRIRSTVRTCYRNLKAKAYTLDELALKVMIGKPLGRYVKTTPQHVKAASLLVEAGHEIKTGDIISFVKTTNALGVKPVQLASLREVDVNKYVEYLESTFEQVLDALDLDFQEIMGISKLESFLWNPEEK
jgi:DNA polymerase I